jgi:hypothetical protein
MANARVLTDDNGQWPTLHEFSHIISPQHGRSTQHHHHHHLHLQS